MKKIEALPARVPERRTNILIDSNSLYSYLIGELRDQPGKNFDTILDMSPYTAVFKAINNEGNIVLKYSADEVIIENSNSTGPDHPIFEMLDSDYNKKRVERRKSKKTQGEVGSIIYYDKRYGRMFYTPIVKGEYSKVSLNYDTLYEDMNRGLVSPALEVHNHPTDTLYSLKDLSGIMKKKSTYQRVVRGSVLVLPSMQLLALATNETPHFDSWEEVNLKIEELASSLKSTLTNKQLPLRNAYRQHTDELEKISNEMLPTLLPKFDELNVMREKYNMSAEDVRSAMRAIIYYSSPGFLALIEENDKLETEYETDLTKLSENTKLNMLKSLGLKLYSSTDMKRFTAFTS